MNILAVVALILLIAVEIIALINSRTVQKENRDVYRHGLQALRNERDSLQDRLTDAEETNAILLASKGFSNVAFAITSDGMKILPKNWHELCYSKKKKS